MYLVKTKSGDKILETANEVKSINKSEVVKIYSLSEVEYDSIVSDSDIRDCVYNYLENNQKSKRGCIGFCFRNIRNQKIRSIKSYYCYEKRKGNLCSSGF